MKAWLLDELRGLDRLHLAEVPDPIPGDSEVILDIDYAALNPADRYLAENAYPGKPKFPHILGRDGVGTISALGSDVNQFKIGQRVLIIRGDTGVNRWGSFAERVAISAESVAVAPVEWSLEQSAGAALVYLTAHQALTQWGDLPPSIVLITGASGGVGVASIHVAKALGHTVVALSRDSQKREKLREFGADHVLDPADSNWPANLKKSLAPKRVDLAIDNVGGAAFNQLLETLGPHGKVSVVGALAGPVQQFNTPSLLFRRLRIGGIAPGTYSAGEARSAWQATVAILNRTGAQPVVDQIFPFDQLRAAFDRLAAGPLGKVLIDIRNSGSNPLRSRP
jgi:NADPH2:quinone reductase